MAVMLAYFHSSGSCTVSSAVLKIVARSVDIVFFISDNIRGCRLSGPGDFDTLSLDRFFSTISLLIL